MDGFTLDTFRKETYGTEQETDLLDLMRTVTKQMQLNHGASGMKNTILMNSYFAPVIVKFGQFMKDQRCRDFHLRRGKLRILFFRIINIIIIKY